MCQRIEFILRLTFNLIALAKIICHPNGNLFVTINPIGLHLIRKQLKIGRHFSGGVGSVNDIK